MGTHNIFRTAPVLYLAAALFLAAPTASADDDVVSVKSPDGRIEFRMFDGPPAVEGLAFPHLVYEVTFNGKPLINQSHLGFEVANQLVFGHKLGLMEAEYDAVDQTYTLPAGKARTIRNHYNEVVARYLQNGSVGRRMTMEVRAFNDGVAFRYVVPRTAVLEDFQIENEVTEFVFAQDADTYPLLLDSYETGYQEQYSKLTLSGIHRDSLIGLPFLAEQPGVAWVAITEADLDEYSGLYLEHKDDRMMKARLAPRRDGQPLAVRIQTPMVTPWRVILISDRPEKLLESNIVTSLNRASTIKDDSWIKPGKAISTSAADAKAAIDFAAASGLEYALIEAGWSAKTGNGYDDLTKAKSEIDMPALLSYAKQKGIGVWLWANWRSVESQMDEAFALYEKWGVSGVLVDGMDREDQAIIPFYRKVAKTAAEHHLMLDFHGAFKPDGMERTFPNVLTREAVLSSAYSKWGARANPEHDAMLAYTRLLAGPVDYAPGGFNNAMPAEFSAQENKPMTLGTRAHQLALFVVLQSSLQVLAGSPADYQGEKDFEYIKNVPASWDETRGLAGEAGKYVAVARKHGSDWFLGAITDWTARELDVPLAFLSSGDYIAEVYADAADAGTNPKHTTITQQRVNSRASLHLKLASGGGAAIRFRPAN